MKKKPRKSRPNPKQPRATKAAAAPRHAEAAPARTPQRGDILKTAEVRLASALTTATWFAHRGRTELARLARTTTRTRLAPNLHRLRTRTRALALSYSHDERQALTLLFLPFLLVAYAIVVHQSARTLHGYVASIAMPEEEVAPLRPAMVRDTAATTLLRPAVREAAPSHTALAAVRAAPETRASASPERLLAAQPVTDTATAVSTPTIRLAPDPRSITLAPARPSPAIETPAKKLALLMPAGELPRSVRPLTPDPIETLEADANGKPIRPGICAIDQAPRAITTAALGGEPAALGAEAFGLRLAKAAEAQVGGFVIYNDAYRRISYPMGDVHQLYGVCTDVIVRAYRALGLDLQALVRETRAGRGDTNIDQRRTEVLRRFFAREGESLPVTTFPEDYRPGDIVTYYRPQNRRTRTHIAIVSSVMAPSGRPMIVHNRGWGPELEDALFVDEITGHYRYSGPAPTRNAAASGTGNQGSAQAPDAAAPVLPASFAASHIVPPQARH